MRTHLLVLWTVHNKLVIFECTTWSKIKKSRLVSGYLESRLQLLQLSKECKFLVQQCMKLMSLM